MFYPNIAPFFCYPSIVVILQSPHLRKLVVSARRKWPTVTAGNIDNLIRLIQQHHTDSLASRVLSFFGYTNSTSVVVVENDQQAKIVRQATVGVEVVIYEPLENGSKQQLQWLTKKINYAARRVRRKNNFPQVATKKSNTSSQCYNSQQKPASEFSGKRLVLTLITTIFTACVTIGLWVKSNNNSIDLYKAKQAIALMDEKESERKKINDAIINIRKYQYMIQRLSASMTPKNLADLRSKEIASRYQLIQSAANGESVLSPNTMHLIKNYIRKLPKNEKHYAVFDNQLRYEEAKINNSIIKNVCKTQINYDRVIAKIKIKDKFNQYQCS